MEATLAPARARDPGGRRLQKLFHNQRSWSWGVLFSTGSRGNDNNCGSRMPPMGLIVTIAQSAILGCAQALDLRLEQLRARIEGKRRRQRRCFCASFGSQLRSSWVSDLASSAICTGWQVGTKSPVRVRRGSLAGQCKVRPPMKPAAVLLLWATNSSSSSMPPPTLQ